MKTTLGDIRTREDASLAKNIFFRRIRVVEVRNALKQIKTWKAICPYDIPIEAWKYFGQVGGI